MLPNKNLLPAICIFLSALGLFSSGCNIINPAEPVPTYVHLDSFAFVHNPNLTTDNEGSFSHKVTAVYVYFNGTAAGVFNLPVTFPVLADKPGLLTMFPAVDINGLSGLELTYPPYAADSFTMTPSPGNTITHAAKTRYVDGTVLSFSENFDNVNSSQFTLNTPAPATYSTSLHNADVFEGDGSGHIHLQNAGDTATIASQYFVPSLSNDVYVEFDYKSTVYAQIGLHTDPNANTGEYSEYLIGINPRSTYGKFYIPIRSFIAQHAANKYQLLIRTQVPAGQAGGDFFIDNVKVVSLTQ